jgi:uncharacterized membrane protein YkvI
LDQNSRAGLLIKVMTVYAGTVIGAGFASGQEIMQFFISFGVYGLWGVGLATVLFVYLGLLIMFLATRLQTSNYQELLRYLLGKRAGRVMDFISLLMLPGGLVVMLAGSGAVFSEQLGLPRLLGTSLAAVVTCLVVMKGLPGVLTANIILVPLKISALVVVSLLALLHQGALLQPFPDALPVNRVAGHWSWSSVLYVSYNMVVPVAVLSSLGRTVPVGIGMLGGALGGLILGITAGLITLAGLAFYPEVLNYQVPVLFIARSAGFMLQSLLSLLIRTAILTTAIAGAHGFASRLAPGGGWRYRLAGIGATLLAMPLASLDFNCLVQLLYPLFGYAGLILLFALILAPVIKKRGNLPS